MRIEQLYPFPADDYSAVLDRYKNANEVVWLVGVLKGAFMLTSDLARSLTIPCQIHFVQASSYGSEKVSSGQVQLANTLDVAGQHVVLIEDIYDTGNTLKHVLRDLQQQTPASLEVCTLLDKQIPDKCPIEVKYLGFEIPKRFVVGYGLDYAARYRELPYIACLDCTMARKTVPPLLGLLLLLITLTFLIPSSAWALKVKLRIDLPLGGSYSITGLDSFVPQ